ncbi:MAG: efflux RND transporter periplasmic adaptor subunit [Xanthomonadales bacterium]|nr:efflux RND transporter periplasmic adaptor subunit [Xanthomonadales bacterium]
MRTVTLLLAAGPALVNAQPALETLPAVTETTPLEQLFDGTVEAVNQATVSAQTSGRISEILFDVDDYVEAGTVIVRFTSVEQRAALERARSSLREAEARRIQAESEYQRTRALYDAGSGSERELNAAVAARDSARARVEAAQAAVQSAQQQVDYTEVKAPYPGIVTRRSVEVGEAVSPGQPLMSGLSLDQLRVVVDLPQEVAAAVRSMKKARVVAGDTSVEPTRITVFPFADRATNTFQVRLDLPEGQYGLYPGMFVKTAFVVGQADRLLIPESSLVRRSEMTGVYVAYPDGEVRLRQLRLGPSFGQRVEVLAGLEAGEQIVTDPVAAGIFVKAGG